MYSRFSSMLRDNRWYVYDMVLSNALRFIGVLVISSTTMGIMSEYMIVISITAFSVLFGMLGMDQEYLIKWTKNPAIYRNQIVSIFKLSFLAFIVSLLFFFIYPQSNNYLLPFVVILFTVNRFLLLFCYSIDEQKTRFYGVLLYQLLNLCGIIIMSFRNDINFLLLSQIIGYLLSSLYLILVLSKFFALNINNKEPFIGSRPLQTYLIQLSNNLINRADIYLGPRFLSSIQIDRLAAVISYSDVGDILPKTFNSVLAVKSERNSSARVMKLSSIVYSSCLLVVFILSYFIVNYFLQIVSLEIIILMALYKALYFGGNVLQVRYFFERKKIPIIILNISTIMLLILSIFISTDFSQPLVILAVSALLRFVIFYRSV